MFGSGYFAASYFATSYWPETGGTGAQPAPPAATGSVLLPLMGVGSWLLAMFLGL